MGVLAYSGLGLRGLTLAHADHPQPWEIPSVMGVLAYSGLGLRGLTLAHAGHPQPWEIPGVMPSWVKAKVRALPPYPPPPMQQWGIHSVECTYYMYARFQ